MHGNRELARSTPPTISKCCLILNLFCSHLKVMERGGIRPLTKSRFEKGTVSNYNHCYSSLLTVDQIREINKQYQKQVK